MFEIDQYEQKLHAERPSLPRSQYSPVDDVAEMSFLVWGEHCTECAAPACYQSCDLYRPRLDSRCRRFQFGIHRNRHFASFRGYGAEVVFKKWGVMAATGNTAMAPRPRVAWQERLMAFGGKFLSAMGPAIARITRDERWQYPVFGLSRRLSSWLHRRNSGRTKPDAFLLEVYNPGPDPVRMQLGMDYAPEARHGRADMIQIWPRFRTTLAFAPGYSRHEFDRRLFESFTETGLPFNVTLTPEADAAAHLVFLTADFVRYRSRKASGSNPKLPDVKCVVWDLDNTMWDGILVEDDNVGLKRNVEQILQALDERGILSSIASKNTHEAAWRKLEQLGIAEYFLVPQINWSPKSESVRNIARRLNIGLDTMAFIDDNPFELNEVGVAVPEVACINVKDVDGLLCGERFQGSKTADARSRRRYYQEAIVREDTQAAFGDDYLRFLAHCEIRLEIRGCGEADFDRVAELVQRTNQLNFSGRKYEREQLRQILDDPGLEKYVLDCSDKFGAYGLIGFGMVRYQDGAIEVQDLMLSCRVQGKLVEQAFFNHIESQHNRGNLKRLRVNFIETKRNQPARQALEAAGLQKLEAEGGYVREIQPGRIAAEIVRVTCDACCKVTASALG
jgi:FkbH-like protein